MGEATTVANAVFTGYWDRAGERLGASNLSLADVVGLAGLQIANWRFQSRATEFSDHPGTWMEALDATLWALENLDEMKLNDR